MSTHDLLRRFGAFLNDRDDKGNLGERSFIPPEAIPEGRKALQESLRPFGQFSDCSSSARRLPAAENLPFFQPSGRGTPLFPVEQVHDLLSVDEGQPFLLDLANSLAWRVSFLSENGSPSWHRPRRSNLVFRHF